MGTGKRRTGMGLVAATLAATAACSALSVAKDGPLVGAPLLGSLGSSSQSRPAGLTVATAYLSMSSAQEAAVESEEADLEQAEHLGLSDAFARGSRSLSPDDRRHVLAAIVRESRHNGVDPLLTAAVIQVESHFNPKAISQVGACGLMQLMPPTATFLAASGHPVRRQHLFDPQLNIQLGTRYLAQLLDRFDGDLHRALIAYNAGPSVARSLVRGSRSDRRLGAYPRAVLSEYRKLALAQTAVGQPRALVASN